LCFATLSWSTKVIVVPGATLNVVGEKFVPDPAPCGIVIVAPDEPPLPLVLVPAPVELPELADSELPADVADEDADPLP
jgi:hypothetical protein